MSDVFFVKKVVKESFMNDAFDWSKNYAMW